VGQAVNAKVRLFLSFPKRVYSVMRFVNVEQVTGKAAEDVVLFVGNGTTAAVHKLVESLGLNTPLPGVSIL
jgi:hypothetical protein